jgi:hypothetical protein
MAESSWNVMAHGGAREGEWRGNWRMEWVASTLHTTSGLGVSSITTANAYTSAASIRRNWGPYRFKWTRPFRRKTKSGFCACAITFQTHSTLHLKQGTRWYSSIPDGVVRIFHRHNPTAPKHYSPGTVSDSNRNEHQEYLGGKSGQYIGLTTLPHSCADCLEIWEPRLPGSVRVCPGVAFLYLPFTITMWKKIYIYFFLFKLCGKCSTYSVKETRNTSRYLFW